MNNNRKGRRSAPEDRNKKTSLNNMQKSKITNKKNKDESKGKIKDKVKNNKNTNTEDEIEESDIDNLLEQLMSGDDDKKLSKAEQKKKKKLEEFLIKQLENDDSSNSDDEEIDESEGEQEEGDTFSEEYTIDDTYSSNSSSVNMTAVSSAITVSSTGDEECEVQAKKKVGNNVNGQNGVKRRNTIDVPQACTSKMSKKAEKTNDTEKLKPLKASKNEKKVKQLNKNKKTTEIMQSVAGKSTTRTTNKQEAKMRRRIGTDISAKAGLTSTARVFSCSRKSINGIACLDAPNVSGTSKDATEAPMKICGAKLEPVSPPKNFVYTNSVGEGKRIFSYLINPIKVNEFLSKYWEHKPCLIKRPNNSNYFNHLISFAAIDQMLLNNHIEFTKNIDITSYKNGERLTMNPEGRALPPVVWDFYDEGCSIRLLNPQTFLPDLYSMNATLQEYFHCMIGANVYLTPPNSQGFAPHYDDIEAFILQIEGCKQWKLYAPRTPSEELPRYSSKNLKQNEIGVPILEDVLEPGDILYFPRGTIHQANTIAGKHSLHITLSVYQKQSYADLFEKMLPLILKKSIDNELDLRKGVPLNIWRSAGNTFNKDDSNNRQAIQTKIRELLHKFIRDVPLADIIDEAVDQMAKKFQHEALPPDIAPKERNHTIFGSKSSLNEQGECIWDYDIDVRTSIRLLRANIIRLVKEDDEETNTPNKFHLYYYVDNSKEYCQYKMNFIEVDLSQVSSIETLIRTYPQYLTVGNLPMPTDEGKIQLASGLWEKGLLMMEKLL